MGKGTGHWLALVAFGLSSGLALAQARLEIPAADSLQSGIGLVSGWSCTRPDGVEIDGALYPVPWGSPRGDVLQAGACAKAEVGFGLLLNWANLPPGPHQARLMVGGAAGPAIRFTTPVPPGEFLRGLAREVMLPDFPAPGQLTTLVWQEAQQNFTILAVGDRAQATRREVLHTRLAVDLAGRSATASIDLGASADVGARTVLEAGGLRIRQVRSAGQPVPWQVTAGRLEVRLPVPAAETARIDIDYDFSGHGNFDGLLANGSTFLWPYHCGNLFPCNPDPADGSSFELAVTGTPQGLTTIYPARLATAPAYQLAWATGRYQTLTLGALPSGARLVAHALEGQEAAAREGTRRLRAVLAWYEQHFGPYPFGRELGPVAVAWNGGYGGMEHHPYWHVAATAMADPLVHAHEAAHAWFGGSLRLACWEDFTLSEGIASYLAALAEGAVAGAAEEARIWAGYRQRLDAAMAAPGPKVARPEGCGRVDILKDGLYGDIPYMKGAFFWRALELRIGRDAVLDALADLYRQHRFRSAGLGDTLARIAARSGYDTTACARDWLQQEPLPLAPGCP